MTAQLGHLVGDYQQRLERAGVFDPLDDAKVLLAHAIGMDEAEVYLSSGDVLPEN